MLTARCSFIEGFDEAGVYRCSGLTILDFESETSAFWISGGATVTMNGCALSSNVVTGKYYSAVVSVNAVDPDSSSSQQQDTILRLQQCTLANNTAPNIIFSDGQSSVHSLFDVEVYSDEERAVFYTKNDAMGTTSPLSTAPASRPGITASSPWFIGVQQVRPQEFYNTHPQCCRSQSIGMPHVSHRNGNC